MLQLAEELGNVSKACKIIGYSRSQFYEIKRAFQTGGLTALLDKAPALGTTPHKVPEEIEKKVIELSIEHPAWGQQRIADELVPRGVVVSHGTVRNIWIRHNMENRYKRLLLLEEKTSQGSL